MQNILFPMHYMRITTGINELSHLGSNAIDCAGKDTGIDNAWAPFTGTIKRIYALGHTVWIESNEKVQFADGTIDYATASFTHDSIVSDLSVGQVIQQGQIFYQEGTANATGAHIHLEIGRGKFTGKGWYQNAQGNWVINNSYIPYNAFWLKSDTIILNGHNYPWKKEITMAGIDGADLTAIYELGPLGRSRSPGEGDNVYLGKTANFVLRDHASSAEGKAKAASQANKDVTITNLTNENKSLKGIILEKDAQIKALQDQIAAGGGGEYKKVVSSGQDLYIKV